MKRMLIIGGGVLIALGMLYVGIFYWKNLREVAPVIKPPAQDISNLIRVSSPKENDIVKNPLVVTGEARGYWFFEASFPVKLFDGNGKEISHIPAQAQSEWMTENFVPFKATLEFETPKTATGTLVLEKDNPSGLPEHDNEIRIPMRFDTSITEGVSKSTCKIIGCSGQVCSDKEVITTCEYTSQYACYKNARCERQANGTCGWTETSELKACLGVQ